MGEKKIKSERKEQTNVVANDNGNLQDYIQFNFLEVKKKFRKIHPSYPSRTKCERR